MGEFLEYLKSIAGDTRAYDGCELFDIYTDTDRPGRVFFYEIWESKDKQLKYLDWRNETGVVEKLGTFLTGAPEFSYLEKSDA